MQIAILGRDIRPPWNEAVKNMAYELAKQLSNLGHHVHLISDDTDMIPKIANLQVHSIPRSSFAESALKLIMELDAAGKIDLIHIQNLIIHRSLAGLVKALKKKSRVPVAAYCCQLPVLSISHWLKILRKDPEEAFSSKIGMLAPAFLTKSAMKSIDMTIASSKYLQQRLSGIEDIDSSLVIHPFVSVDNIKHHFPTNNRRTNDSSLLYLGNHRVLRGEDDFLKMVARLKQSIPNVKATLVTTQPIPRRIQRIVESEGLAASVEFVPRGVQQDIPGLIEGSDLYVFTGLPPVGSIDPPLTIIESMILGTPVLSYDAGGISEVVPRERLVRYGDIENLARRARESLKTSSAKNPRHDLLEKFSSESATRRFEELYEKLV